MKKEWKVSKHTHLQILQELSWSRDKSGSSQICNLDDLLTKLPVLQARLKGLANAARNASCPESVEFWEGRVSEIEFIVDTTGKRTALVFAKSFYSGKSAFSVHVATAQLIELNKRAKLCYRTIRRKHSLSGLDSSLSSDQHNKGPEVFPIWH